MSGPRKNTAGLRYRRAVLLAFQLVSAALLLALTACSSSPATSGNDRTEPTPQATTAQEIQGEGVPLPPGRYTFTPFQPHVTFELGEGFEGGLTNPEFFDVIDGEGAALAFAHPTFVPTRNGHRLEVSGASPKEVLNALTEASGFEVLDELQVTIGSQRVDAIEGVGRTDGAPLFGGPGGEFGIVKGDRYRLAPVDVGETIVLVMQIAFDPPYQQAFAATDPVLPTISFETR